MIITDLFTQVNGAYRGSDTTAPTGGSDFDLWLNITNRKVYEWATDPSVRWNSRFENRAIGTLSASSQTYDLDDDFFAPSDSVLVGTSRFTLVKPQDRDFGAKTAYIAGVDPKQLTFCDTITSDSPLVGGTIYVPGYFIPDSLGAGGDTILVDDPYWLVYAVAAELAFNDLIYQDKFGDLVGKANDRYSKMILANRQGTSTSPRTMRYDVNRIPGAYL